MMKTSIAYLTMLCCYVYYIDDSEKQNNDDVQHIQTYAYESGSPVGMNVTTTTGNASNPTVTTAQYYFIKNLQGDIVAMADATGAIKCSYTYNSWGKVLSVVGPNGTPSLTDYTNPANINPFRYRGYYYDAENQLYWLQSRFYDPNTGRFLNADSILKADDILGANLFVYCSNNPINYFDFTGKAKEWIFNGVTYPYDGSAADFHRLEHGQSPLAYEAAVQKEKAAMAAAVYAEAAAYNNQSKKAVANVIKNRVGTTTVNGKGFRNTIQDVISEPAQFSSYGNKWYNEAITYYNTGTIENEYDRMVLKETMRVIIPIFYNEEEDITCGCTYFYSPISMVPKDRVPDWVSGKTEVIIDGVDSRCFRFYK